MEEGAEDLFAGKDGCRQGRSSIAPLCRIQSLQYAVIQNQYEHVSTMEASPELTHCICSRSIVSDIFSLILSEFTKVHRES